MLMKIIKKSLACLFPAVVIATCCLTETMAAQKPRIIVLDFTGGTGSGDVASEFAEALSDVLVNSGDFNVLERSRLHALMREQTLVRSGLVDPLKAAELGKLLGAEYAVTGIITEADVRRMNFDGYGVQTSKIEATLGVSVRIINLDKGNIIFSRNEKVIDTRLDANESSWGGDFPTTKLSQAVCAKLGPAIHASRNFGREKANPAKVVTVKFKSTPKNATIEIDGIVRGNTGGKFEFPVGIHQVKINASGYKEWSKQVNFQEGLCIEVNLVRE